jgi:hypothetical protein
MKRRIAALEEELDILEKNRMTMRASRDRSGIPKVAIVGYTNAGKSTLLNRLTNAGILAEDKLFATLDPTTRRLALPTGEEVLLTDTVGLIRGLPHHLVEAFRSTLEEAAHADILLILADYSDAEREEELAQVFERFDCAWESEEPLEDEQDSDKSPADTEEFEREKQRKEDSADVALVGGVAIPLSTVPQGPFEDVLPPVEEVRDDSRVEVILVLLGAIATAIVVIVALRMFDARSGGARRRSS